MAQPTGDPVTLQTTLMGMLQGRGNRLDAFKDKSKSHFDRCWERGHLQDQGGGSQGMAAWGLYHRSTGQCATKYTNTWEDEATRKDMKDTTLLGPGEVLQICLFIAAAGGEVLQIWLSIAAAGKGSAERGKEGSPAPSSSQLDSCRSVTLRSQTVVVTSYFCTGKHSDPRVIVKKNLKRT